MIAVKSLEIHVSYHCNLSCKGCSHMTPLEKEKFIDENDIYDKLKILSKCLHCEVIRLIGGEPTLNKNLADIAKNIKKINIADKIAIATNGIFIDRLNDKVLKNIDVFEISNYHYSDYLTNKIINWAKLAKEKYNIKTYIYMYKNFRESISFKENNNKDLVKKIYDTCIVSHDWQCFNVFEGYFFKCPQAMAISRNIENNSMNINGIKIEDSDDLEKELINYINSTEPLKACSHCLGTVGKYIELKQIPKNKYKDLSNNSIDEMIDYDFLEKNLEKSTGDMFTVENVIEI